jgi:hypothetical protein
LRQIQLLVEEPLAERAFPEEADGDATVLEVLRRVRGSGGDAGAAAHDRIRAEVARGRIGDVHRAALALAVADLLAEQLREHQLRIGALGQAVPVAAVRARDVVVLPERLAHPDGNGLLADVEMRQARHQRARVQVVDALLEQANRHHLAI